MTLNHAQFEVPTAQVAEFKEIIKRLEHLVAERNHAVHGKRSETLYEDERPLLFEELEVDPPPRSTNVRTPWSRVKTPQNANR